MNHGILGMPTTAVFPLRSLQRYAGILVGSILAMSSLCSTAAFASTCGCKQHPAQAEAEGTCSRTEDRESCTLSFTSATSQDNADFVANLQQIASETFGQSIQDPDGALSIAFEMKPEQWDEKIMREVLPALFAISQKTTFSNVTPAVFKALATTVNSPMTSNILDAFRENDHSPSELQVGEFSAIVSYGCIELQVGSLSNHENLRTMVKTRWATFPSTCNE